MYFQIDIKTLYVTINMIALTEHFIENQKSFNGTDSPSLLSFFNEKNAVNKKHGS